MWGSVVAPRAGLGDGVLGLVAPVLLLLRIRVLVGAVRLAMLELPLVMRLVDFVNDFAEVL